jgi:predicted DNA-binding WGR domain protein
MMPAPALGDASHTASAAAAFTQYVHFVSVDLAENRRRFYTLTWQPDLWGGGALVRSWGRVGRQGQQLVEPFPTRETAQLAIDRLVRRRLQRGYQVTAWE